MTSHKYFLSNESTVYLILTDASLILTKQKERMDYWCHLLCNYVTNSQKKFIVFLVGEQ